MFICGPILVYAYIHTKHTLKLSNKRGVSERQKTSERASEIERDREYGATVVASQRQKTGSIVSSLLCDLSVSQAHSEANIMRLTKWVLKKCARMPRDAAALPTI